MARRSLWIPVNTGSSTAAAGSSQVDLLGNLAAATKALGGLTVSRVVGELKYRTDVIGTYQQFSAGIMAKHEDFSAGQLSLSSEGGSWMWTLYTRTSGMFIEVASADFDAIEEVRMIDIRTQRKIQPEHSLFIEVQNGAGETLNWNIGLRVLVLLP